MRRAVVLWCGWLAMAGCHNPCQSVCTRMKNYAEDCGIQVPDADLEACFERQKQIDHDDAKACRDYGDPAAIENQWSCEDLEVYWSPSTS